VQTWLQKKGKKKEKKRKRKNDRMLIKSNSTLLTQFSSAFNVSGQGPFEWTEKLAITRELWIQYILPP
jgi:hypothetical protein